MVYKESPWIFKGKALYQLQLVKTEEARKYVPDQFKLVELFGYTLGGFYLARYTDSPVGAFDELVALAGLVWNAPTSCAWAARVYVNNREARDHGVRHVGLPSRLAAFSLAPPQAPAAPGAAAGQARQQAAGSRHAGNWWLPAAAAPLAGEAKQQQQQQQQQPAASNVLELRNTDSGRGRALSVPVCHIALPRGDGPLGPRIKLSLPSFSGATPEVPGLLRYACDLATNVGLVAPCSVTVPPPARGEEDSPECLAAVLRGRPLLALEFAAMEMRVEEPEVLLLAQHGAEAVQRWALPKTASLTTAWAAQRT